MLRLIPRMLAFKAVQRQIAASRSRRPPSAEQQCGSGGFPTTVPILPFSNLAHTPSFRASLGQCPLLGVGFGVGFGLGLGLGVGMYGQPLLQPLTSVKKRRLKEKKNTSDRDLFDESIDGLLAIPIAYNLYCGWLNEAQARGFYSEWLVVKLDFS